jgi:hypothetical protein
MPTQARKLQCGSTLQLDSYRGTPPFSQSCILESTWPAESRRCFHSHQPFQFAAIEVKLGSGSVNAILAGQLGGCRLQFVGPPKFFSPLLEAGADLVDCERPVFAAHFISP